MHWFAKDLNEFASTVTSHLFSAADGRPPGEAAAAVAQRVAFAGDDGFPEAAIFPVDDAKLLALQRDAKTFSEPVPDADVNAWANRTLALDEGRWTLLLENAHDVKAMFATFVEGGAIASSEFFLRYFFRLTQLRLEESRRRRAGSGAIEQGPAAAAMSSSSAAVELSAWDDDEVSVVAKPPEPGLKPAALKAPADATEEQTLQQIVAALNDEIRRLRAENGALRAENERFRAAAAAVSAGAAPAAAAEPAKKVAEEEDDDWTNLA